MNKTTVLIIDDHAVLRMGLASLINAQKDLSVIGDASCGEEGVRLAATLRPDVAIVDMMMPEMDGVETTRRLRKSAPRTKVMILTSYGESDGIAHALDAGATGAIIKNAKLPELVGAIRTVATGGKVLSPDIERMLDADPPIPRLSPRQTEILRCIVRGFSNPDISKALGISLPVVKEHVKALREKIGAANRAEAVAIATRKQLLKM